MLNNSHIINRLTEGQKIRLLTDIRSAEDPELNALGVPRVRWRAACEGRDSAYPAPSVLARSWDPDLLEKVTEAQCYAHAEEGADHLSLPSAKPRLTPYGEGFSEDPRLSGVLAAACFKGAQSTGMSVSPEGYGFTAAERKALRGEITPRFAHTFLHEPFRLLSEWGGCEGVVTEPGAVLPEGRDFGRIFCRTAAREDTVKAIAEGRLLLRGSEEAVRLALQTYRRIKSAVEHGKATTGELEAACACGEAMSEETLDRALDRFLDFAAECAAKGSVLTVPAVDHRALARRAAVDSAVLLENRQRGKDSRPTLPLWGNKRISVIGGIALADKDGTASLTAGLTAAGQIPVGTAAGYSLSGERNDELTEEALSLAALSDTVLLFVGTTAEDEARMEREGTVTLPPVQRALCHRLSCLDKDVVVILSTRVAADLSFLTETVHPFAAVLLTDVETAEGLRGVADILTGSRCPGGRLPVTLCAHGDSADRCHTHRRVGPFVGYRYYDTVGCGFLYPFGYGLSYTAFRYSGLREENGCAVFTLKNVGKVAGAEVAQVYSSLRDSAVLRPAKELVGFVRVWLEPGEQKTVTVPLGGNGIFSEEAGRLLLEKGNYTLSVGRSVADICLTRTLQGGADTLPPDGEDPADYLPTVSNITSQRYVMEAEYTPMKSSLRNLICGITALCLAVGLKIYDIVTMTDSVFLNIVAVILAVCSALCFGMEFLDRRKQAALDAEGLETATGELFSDAATIPVPSAEELFDESLYIPAEPDIGDSASAEEEQAYDHFADVDKALTFGDAAADFRALAAETGLLLSEDTVHSLMAALASSRLLAVRGMTREKLAALVASLGEYFGTVSAVDSVDGGIASESALLFDEAEDGTRTPRGLFTVMEAAARERGGIHIAALTGVQPADVSAYFVPFARHAHTPTAGCTVTAKNPEGEETTYRIPENLWLILHLAEGTSLCELPDYVTEVTAGHVWDAELTAPTTEARRDFRRFGYGQMDYLCDRLRGDFSVDEDTWKRIDRLEAYAARFGSFRISNKLWRGLEMYMAVLMVLGASEPAARDASLAARLLPHLIPVLSGQLPREERSFAETLESILGEGNAVLCQKTVKESGADLR